jgi:hypothetical protein
MPNTQPIQYEIRVHGHVAKRYSDWFDLSLEHGFDHGQPITTLRGPLPDQSALHGVLGKIQALGIALLDLRQLEPQT